MVKPTPKKSLPIHGKAQEIRNGHGAVATELGPASCLSSTCKAFDLGHPGEAVDSVFVSFCDPLPPWAPVPEGLALWRPANPREGSAKGSVQRGGSCWP